ncbi:MAG TPA: radical SAM protein [Thermotoga sp.]|uniref:B12-binding domain-containing radical SAM protein n=1 Tax=Thermotoga sp. (strain RQ2) TaxID=126740 RepID=UPI000160188F|nr:radical SAM protein [Thermotoga sp. RQ2]HBF69089.1 radical SAM protein [Thermotoga sp.]
MRRPRRPQDFLEYEKVLKFKESEKQIEETETKGDVRVALVVPSGYEVAASGLAFHYVQKLLNSHPRIRCERFFYDETFKKFYSLETQTPIDEFSIWLFSVSFENDFSNLLDILKKKDVPLSWKEREDYHPIIIAGGAVTYLNEEFLIPVADAVYYGELEKYLDLFTEALTGETKQEILSSLSRIPAVEVPSLKEHTEIAAGVDLNDFLPHSSVVPSLGVFPGKLLVEVGRGCIRRCAFCIFGKNLKPARFVKPERFEELVRNTPYREYGLISATITDYPWLEDLLDTVEKYQLKISVSSLRLDRLSERLLRTLKDSGQRSFTIAPEAGSQRIRDILKKDITDEQIENALKLARRLDFDRVKMYFIYGLEEETEEDLEAFKKLGDLAVRLGYREVHMSFNPLIPKPGTEFERRKMEPVDVLRKKEKILKNLLKGFRVDFESIRESVVQYTIAHAGKEEVESWLKFFEKSDKKSLGKLIYEEGRKRLC